MINLLVWSVDLWYWVTDYERLPLIKEWIKELTTIQWQKRAQYFFEKASYSITIRITVALLEDLVNEICQYPIVSVQYAKTWTNLINPTLCFVRIEKEDFRPYRAQLVWGAAETSFVDVTLSIIEA